MNLLYPLPLAPENRDLMPRLHMALVEELYRQSRVSLAALCLVLVLVRIVLAEAASRQAHLDWVFLGLIAAIGGRMVWQFILGRHPERFPSVEVRHIAFILGTTLTSLGFTALNVLIFPQLGPFPLALYCVCMAGITSTAMVSMAGSPLAYLLYLVPMIGSLAVMAILHPLPVLPHAFVFILLSFLTTQVLISLAVHRTWRDNFLLQLKLGDMALRDTLTGLRNRRYLQEIIEAEIARLNRAWHPSAQNPEAKERNLAVIMLDLDHFKAVNDTYGHAAGDEVLKQVAQLIDRTARKPDLVARWGGEEFVILVQDAPRSLPMVAAERIRCAVESHVFHLPSGETIQRTCSLGYAHYPFLPEHPEQFAWDDVMHLADIALYQAKQRGRNRTLGIVPGEREPELLRETLQTEEQTQAALARGALRLTEQG